MIFLLRSQYFFAYLISPCAPKFYQLALRYTVLTTVTEFKTSMFAVTILIFFIVRLAKKFLFRHRNIRRYFEEFFFKSYFATGVAIVLYYYKMMYWCLSLLQLMLEGKIEGRSGAGPKKMSWPITERNIT